MQISLQIYPTWTDENLQLYLLNYSLKKKNKQQNKTQKTTLKALALYGKYMHIQKDIFIHVKVLVYTYT